MVYLSCDYLTILIIPYLPFTSPAPLFLQHELEKGKIFRLIEFSWTKFHFWYVNNIRKNRESRFLTFELDKFSTKIGDATERRHNKMGTTTQRKKKSLPVFEMGTHGKTNADASTATHTTQTLTHNK